MYLGSQQHIALMIITFTQSLKLRLSKMFKLSIEDEGINEFLDELTDMELKIKSPDFKREVLEAMAMPVVRSAKVNVARSFKTRSGNLQEGNH